jgi:hypothetical protein
MGEFPNRILLSHAPPEAYAPMTRAILAKLGYAILVPNEYEAVVGEADVRPVIRIVDERQLAEVPDDGDAIPIIVISGRYGVTGADSRIIGAVRRPAGMHELFRLIQGVTEDTPRTTPRIPTHLSVRCTKDGKEWGATVLSISENGCLMRSPEPLNLGAQFELELRFPRETIQVEAEAAYQLLPDLGLIFHAIPTRHHEAIQNFVATTLITSNAEATPGVAS